jgi:hypothetical protein
MGFPEGSDMKAPGEFYFPLEPFLSSAFIKREKGVDKMKKMLFLAWLIVFSPAMVFAQEKVEAPAWNVGDKWTFTGDGNIEVIKSDQSGYILKFSDRKCIAETQTCNTILFERSTRNRINVVEGDKRKKYVLGLSKILDFPLSIGKQWKTGYSSLIGTYHQIYLDYSEFFKVLAWEEVKIHGGIFKALKIEYKRVLSGSSSIAVGSGQEFINHYWYSPDVKYFVKCQYDKDWIKEDKKIFNWELTSFQLKK